MPGGCRHSAFLAVHYPAAFPCAVELVAARVREAPVSGAVVGVVQRERLDTVHRLAAEVADVAVCHSGECGTPCFLVRPAVATITRHGLWSRLVVMVVWMVPGVVNRVMVNRVGVVQMPMVVNRVVVMWMMPVMVRVMRWHGWRVDGH